MPLPDQSLIAAVTSVSHRYEKVIALDNISFEIPAGCMVGLLGPDGVGKSTLLGLLSGSRKLQEGSIEVLGGDMRSARERRSICSEIAYMPQGLGKNLYMELSVSENLDFFAKLFEQSPIERKHRIERLTRATGLHPFLNRPVGKLSGGMKQKLGLCCALIHDPDFLLLDEPTTGIDPLSRRQFWQLIDAIRANNPAMSVLVSTAYMDEVERFDRLIAMDEGRILAKGSPKELKERTETTNLEEAFIALLPGQKHDGRDRLKIPELELTDQRPALSARGLTRRFGNFTAVDNVSFDIAAGEIFGFVGSNGCGKTTTMKMLTGLLPASQGEAYLFGIPVDAHDLEARKRVGFMSQLFSLYGELTVAQNLNLHARLFHLDRDKSARRIEKLIERFGLEEHRDAPAGELPLGLRQRLSLAVAVIHEPEVLILDEPTSGVDPIARDDFWKLLVELSRENKVTIFISTHFMNEAARCDRIALMHAGKVLACEKPGRLIEEKKASSLEEAFIFFMEEASEDGTGVIEQTNALNLAGTQNVEAKKSYGRSIAGLSVTRLLAYSYRESMEVIRDPVRLAFAFVGSVILLAIMAYGISLDVNSLTYAALDYDKTPESRRYLSNFSASRYFIERPPLSSKFELDARLKSNDITLAIEIPPGFGREMKRNSSPEIAAWIDGANTMRAGTIEGYVAGGHAHFISDHLRELGLSSAVARSAVVEPRFRYNPSFESIFAIGPSIPALLLLLFPAILMAVSIAREKEIGTITNFYVTPTTRIEFLLGKQLPYIAIGVVNFLILTVFVILVFGVPLKGSVMALAVGALLYIAASTAYGLLISSITGTQVAAVFAVAVLSMLPTLQFSGLVQPVSTLEASGRLMGALWPTTYYMHLSVGAFTKGLGFSDLTTDIVALAAFTPVFIALAALLLKKQEK